MNTIIKIPTRPLNSLKLALAVQLAITSSSAWSLQIGCPNEKIKVNISAQEMDKALNELAQESGFKVVFYSDVVKGIKAKAISGEYETCEKAIDALLTGTGLRYSVINDNAVAIHKEDLSSADYGQERLLLAANGNVPVGLKGRGQAEANNISSKAVKKRKFEIVEEVIVTANKREQNLQDIPVAVSALVSQDIEKQGIENFQDFARQLPGVNLIQPRQNRSQFIIRGITTGQAGSRSQDEVATYINDISVTSSYFAVVLPDLRLFDIERVEVLRGPQGTLFGSGSLGGAVRIITNKPSASNFSSSIMLDAGHTKGGAVLSRYSGMVNVPLIENELAVRAAGYYRDEEGYIENSGTGEDKANSTLDEGGRVAIQWAPTDRLTASLTVLAQDSTPEDGDQIDPSLGRYKKNSAYPNELINELRIYNATVDYDLGFATLTSSTTLSKSLGISFEGLNFITDLLSTLGQDSKFTAQEIKLISQMGGPYEWVIGGYFFDQEADQWQFLDIKDPASFAQQFNVTGIPANGRIGDVLSTLEAREKALFGEVSYRLNEQFTITGGLRYSKSNMRFVNLNGIGRVGGFVAAATAEDGGDINDVQPTIFDQDVKADSSVLTGKASISYQPDDNQTYYLLASRGYRVGQANTVQGPDPIDPVNGLNIPAQFEPDSLWNYEFGAKTTWFNGHLLTNLALFYIPWDNIQVAGTRQTDFSTFTGNAGEAVSKGVELEMLLWPTEGLQLGLNLTLQDAKITGISPQDSATTGVLDGDKLPNSPDFQIAGFAEYTTQVRNGWKMFARLDAQYIDSTVNGFSNQAGTPGTPLPGLEESDTYENVNTSMGFENEKWRLIFYAENLTNNDEFTYISPTVFTANKYSVLRPRTLGMRLKYSF